MWLCNLCSFNSPSRNPKASQLSNEIRNDNRKYKISAVTTTKIKQMNVVLSELFTITEKLKRATATSQLSLTFFSCSYAFCFCRVNSEVRQFASSLVYITFLYSIACFLDSRLVVSRRKTLENRWVIFRCLYAWLNARNILLAISHSQFKV